MQRFPVPATPERRNASRRFTPPLSAIPASWRARLSVTMIGASALLLLGACGTLEPPRKAKNPLLEELISSPGSGGEKTVEKTYLQEKAAVFVAAYQWAKAAPKDPERIAAYVESGITYTELLCKSYFDEITESQRRISYAKREAGLAGGLASTVLGLASASTAALAGTGALFGFGTASLEAYHDRLVISPDLTALEGLVRARQAEIETTIHKKLQAETTVKWPGRIATLDQAERNLTEYIFPCSVNGMRSLLDNSLRQKTADIASTLPGVDEAPDKKDGTAGTQAPSALPPTPAAGTKSGGKSGDAPVLTPPFRTRGISRSAFPSIE